MITREKLEEIFDNDEIIAFREKDIDHTMKALTLLREKIPYDVCKSIIGCAEHDKIYLCDVDDVLEHINVEDAIILAECNMFLDEENDCFAMFT